MRKDDQIDLKEWEKSEPVNLTQAEFDGLRSIFKAHELDIDPVPGVNDDYYLKPGSTVGAVEAGHLSVLIHPKIGIPHLLSVACYAIGKVEFQEEEFDFPDAYALPDVLAMALAVNAGRAFSRGLLHGYRTEEEALYTVRGRIRFDEQMRRRFGVPFPVEVRYDEFTDDILANRLVKAAVYRLGDLRLRSMDARKGLGRVVGLLDNVSLVEFPRNEVPEITFDRLNEHYRGVVELSRLILRHSAFESSRGEVRASGFLMDMNRIFQEFVTVALRENLGVSDRAFREGAIPSLDTGGRVVLRPDLVWSEGGGCVFVGDAKYKRILQEQAPNADLYQILAYTTALDLPGGLLVYAQGEADVATYKVRHSGKCLDVAALDLSGNLGEVLTRVGLLAGKVKALRDEARGLRHVNVGQGAVTVPVS